MNEKALAKIDYNVAADVLASIKDKWTIVPDCSDAYNYKLVSAGIAEVVGLRTRVERRRLDLNREYKVSIDSGAREIINFLAPIEEKLRATKKEVDDEKARIKKEKADAEQLRIKTIKDRMSVTNELGQIPYGADFKELQNRFKKIQAIEITKEVYEEYYAEAHAEHQRVSLILVNAETQRSEKEARDAEIKAEQDRVAAEQDRVAAEQAEQAERLHAAKDQQAQEDEKRKRQQRKEDAERKAKAEAEQKKIDDNLAAAKAQLATVAAENKRIADEDALAKKTEYNRLAALRVKEQATLDAREKALEEKEESARKTMEAEAEKQASAEAEKQDRQLQEENPLDARVVATAIIDDEITQSILGLFSMDNSHDEGLLCDITSYIVTAIIAGEIPHVKYTG